MFLKLAYTNVEEMLKISLQHLRRGKWPDTHCNLSALGFYAGCGGMLIKEGRTEDRRAVSSSLSEALGENHHWGAPPHRVKKAEWGGPRV